MSRKRVRRIEKLESRDLLAGSVINEILYDQLFSPDQAKSQYIELRGDAGTALESGTYLLSVASAKTFNNDEGKINGIFDLSGLSFGSNGFLVVLPQGSPFTPDPSANTLRSTTAGFGGLPGNRYTDSDTLSDSLPQFSTSYFLIQTEVPPQLGDDIDTDSDGLVDDMGVFANWNVLDSISVIQGTAEGHGYADIVFVHSQSSTNPTVNTKPGTIVVRPDGSGYVGRIGNSIGSQAEHWVGGTVKDLTGDQYFVRIGNDNHGRPKPLFLHGRELDNLGSENFVGAARVRFFEDVNNNAVFDSGDTPVQGATVFADSNANGFREQIETIIEPDDFADGTELNNLTPGVTLSTAGTDNVVIGFAVTAEQVGFGADAYHVFAHVGIPFMNSTRRLRTDFYRPARSVSVDVIGDSDLTPTYGRFEAYDANGNLLQMLRTAALSAEQRQTLTINRTTDEIAYTIAYSDADHLDSSPFGRFDRYRFSVPEAAATSDADGVATIKLLDEGTYTLFPQTSVLDDFVFDRPSFEITKYENFVFDVPLVQNAPPVINDANLTIVENSGTGTVVGTITASDHSSQKLTYTLLTGTDKFILDPNTGILRARQGAQLNFETQPNININVRVSDNAPNPLSSTRQFTVSLTDVNEPPNLANVQFQVEENPSSGTVIGTLLGTDVDAGDMGLLNYRLIGTIPGQAVSIVGSTGQLLVNNGSYFNFEARTQILVTVEVFDNGQPSLTDTATVTLNLQNVNESPTILTEQMAVGELAIAGTVVGTLQVSDPESDQFHTYQWAEGFSSDEFILDSFSGQILVGPNASFSFADKPEYSVEVTATDSGFPAMSTTKSITIRLIDQNNPPVIQDTELSVDENSIAGTTIGTITVTDPDVSQGHVFGIGSSAGQAVFEIDRNSGEIRVKEGAELDFESQSSWEILVQAWDSGFPSASSTKLFTVTINDVNEAPQIAPNLNLSIGENAGALEELGSIEFSDQDIEDAPVISIVSGNEEGLFDIDPASGLVTVLDGASLDFETKSEYVLSLEVTDGVTPPAQASLTITIEDRNDPPKIVAQLDPLNTVAGNEFEVLIPFDSVADEDADQSLTWTITAEDVDLPDWLSFDPATGVISGLPWNRDVSTYNLLVTATDSGSPPISVSLPLSLEVTFNASPWLNPLNSLDVDGDTLVRALDALSIINYLNRSAYVQVESSVNFRPAYLDVNGNNVIEPLDALIIINHLNRTGGSGEGEFSNGENAFDYNAAANIPSELDELRRRQRKDRSIVDQALMELVSD